MKTIRFVIPILSILLFVACESVPNQPDSQTVQISEETQQEAPQETMRTSEQDADRGFDPCKLNADLAVCKKQ